jgi:hypothetical protein
MMNITPEEEGEALDGLVPAPFEEVVVDHVETRAHRPEGRRQQHGEQQRV